MKRVRLLFFGSLADQTSHIDADFQLPDHITTGEDLIAHIKGLSPELAQAFSQSGLRIAIDQQLCSFDSNIQHAKEIAFMSALSGG